MSPSRKSEEEAQPIFFAMTARDERDLRGRAEKLRMRLTDPDAGGVRVGGDTGRVRRSHRDRNDAVAGGVQDTDGQVRLIALAQTTGELAAALAAFGTGRRAPGLLTSTGGADPRVVFAFSGQGAVRIGMGSGLYDARGSFCEALERCSHRVESVLGISLTSVLYGERDTHLLHDPRFAQPALFALQCGLSAHWHEWGVSPSVVTGHSLGEYAAACTAGAIGVEDASMLVAERGRLAHELPETGLMAVVFADEATVRAEIERQGVRVAIAAINAPQVVVVSGAEEASTRLLRTFEGRGIATRPLEITHALHCSCADPMLDGLERAAARVRFREPLLPLASTLEGRILDAGEIPGPHYWRRHARESVKFLGVVRSLEAAGLSLFLEIGPHTTLTGVGERCLERGTAKWLPSLRRGRDDLSTLSETAMRLWLAGVEVNLAKVADTLNWRYLGPRAVPTQKDRQGADVDWHSGFAALRPRSFSRVAE